MDDDATLFVEEMHWGEQPVRLTALRCDTLPQEAPTTSVHIVAFFGERVLVVRDRRGLFGFPGGRLEHGETVEQALNREVYEEARAYLKPDSDLFAMMKIEYPVRLPNRHYVHDYTYMALYTGLVHGLDPIGSDPAGVVTGRDLFPRHVCEQRLPRHDRILLREAILALKRKPGFTYRGLKAFENFGLNMSTAPPAALPKPAPVERQEPLDVTQDPMQKQVLQPFQEAETA